MWTSIHLRTGSTPELRSIAKCVRWLHEHITEPFSKSIVLQPLSFQKSGPTPFLLLYLKNNSSSCTYTMYSLWTYSKSANTHFVPLLVILGGKSKNIVTFSDRLLILHPVQSSVEDITGEMGLKLVHKEVIIIISASS